MTDSMHNQVVNVLILREVRSDAREAFETTVRDWIPRAVQFPGHLGVFMLTPPPGSNHYGALLRFDSHEAWQRFSEWDDYRAFLEGVRSMLASDPRTEVAHGMEAWFRPPEGLTASPPPRWKMALLTYLGVCVMVWLASQLVLNVFHDPPRWPAYFLINAIVVAGLTWLVMPLFARLAHRWLYGRVRS
ncbi:MAG: antibiotic biosynthesis monooxygenase [Phycisphaerales bacterium]